MAHARTLAMVMTGWLIASPAWSASFTTTNFTVSARQADVARQVAEYAESYRKSKAVEWLGQELPPWDKPCHVQVRITHGGAGGATSFTFDNGQVLGQEMTVEGSLDRILSSVLPHEITHTVFAAKFRRPLPRWADEGGAVLSEDYQELARHDLLVRSLINNGRMIPLSRLFLLTEYPSDVMALYAEGFSVANYLVSLRGRHHFLNFVWEGQQSGWQPAAARYYGFRSIADLEKNWIDWLIAGKGTGADGPPVVASAEPTPSRVVRGQMPDEWPVEENMRRRNRPAAAAVAQPAIETAARQSALADPSALSVADQAAEPWGIRTRQPVPTASPFANPADPSSWDMPARPRTDALTAAPTPRRRRIEPDWLSEPTASAGRVESLAALPPLESSEEPAAAAGNASAKPPRRMIPIAVGRTRRSHTAPAVHQESGKR